MEAIRAEHGRLPPERLRDLRLHVHEQRVVRRRGPALPLVQVLRPHGHRPADAGRQDGDGAEVRHPRDDDQAGAGATDVTEQVVEGPAEHLRGGAVTHVVGAADDHHDIGCCRNPDGLVGTDLLCRRTGPAEPYDVDATVQLGSEHLGQLPGQRLLGPRCPDAGDQ